MPTFIVSPDAAAPLEAAAPVDVAAAELLVSLDELLPHPANSDVTVSDRPRHNANHFFFIYIYPFQFILD
jgi:hypothetical protein